MKELNLGTRIVMFAICASVEYDLKKYILNTAEKIEFTEKMLSKAKERKKLLNLQNEADVLDMLDLGDFVAIITNNSYQYKVNLEKSKMLSSYFETIIPIRNRVMHTKPLELGDRAILLELLEDIYEWIEWIEWLEVTKLKNILHEEPSKLISMNFKPIPQYEPTILNNLPDPEFDDTGYIGRKTEIKEIKSLICNNKNQIISIIGNGGIGKTALTIKLLYELLDEENDKFDAIIWTSLKTRTLDRGEFINIENAIVSLSEMFNNVTNGMVKEENTSAEDNIIKFMDNFRVLLVIDNLETINSEEISCFLKSIPEKSKVLITSRHGLGELEYRYVLNGLNTNDATLYFRELSKYFGLTIHNRSDKEIKDLVDKYLYNNPLSIKWFIMGIFNGLDEKSLILKRQELINFCMSNVIDKLSDKSKLILDIFMVENKQLTLSEIDFFSNLAEVELRKSINELLASNVININKGKYNLNLMAKEYLSINNTPTNEFVINMNKKRRELNSILQDIAIHKESDPFNPKSLYAANDENTKLAAYYLVKALEFSSQRTWEESLKCLNKAEVVAPDYFEVYKIKAFIMAEKNELFEAINNYGIALNKCPNKFSKSTVLYLFSIFNTIKMTDFEEALNLIDEIDIEYQRLSRVQLEKSRILMYLGRYEESREIIEELNKEINMLSDKDANILIGRSSDLCRRIAGTYGIRDSEKKLFWIRKALKQFEKLKNIDTKSYSCMVNILKDLSFLYFNEEAMELLYNTVKIHFSKLESLRNRDYKRMKDVILGKKEEINSVIYSKLEAYIGDIKLNAKHIYEENKGMVVHIDTHFGIIANAHYDKIFFNLNNAVGEIQYGEIVEFKEYTNDKGIAAKCVKKISK